EDLEHVLDGSSEEVHEGGDEGLFLPNDEVVCFDGEEAVKGCGDVLGGRRERRQRAVTRASRMPGVHMSASQAEMERLRRAATTFSWASITDEWWLRRRVARRGMHLRVLLQAAPVPTPDASTLIMNTLPRSGNNSIDVDGIVKFDLYLVSFGVTDSMPVLSLEELDLLTIVDSGAEVVNREDFGQCGLLLGEVVKVARDLGVLYQKS
ncbi:hypothetical protein GW17_00058075, partial [Ensete ventricosum]